MLYLKVLWHVIPKECYHLPYIRYYGMLYLKGCYDLSYLKQLCFVISNDGMTCHT